MCIESHVEILSDTTFNPLSLSFARLCSRKSMRIFSSLEVWQMQQ